MEQVHSCSPALGARIPRLRSKSKVNSASQRDTATEQNGSYWSYSYDARGQVQSRKKYFSNAASGRLTFSWDDLAGTGVTLPDGSAIFSAGFKAVGQNGTSSSLSFVQQPTAIEARVNMAVAKFAPQDGVIQAGLGMAAPRIKNPAQQTGQAFVASVLTAAGKQYVLEASDSLSAPNWTPVDSRLGTGAVVTLRDTTARTAQRFYRVRAY